MLREKAKTPAHVDGYLEMALATQEADGDDVSESAKSSPNLCISTDLSTVFYQSALHGHQHQPS